ncbi:hypothetical protein DFH06DRAFT_1296317 [Mycena polygramma]|nr:hypothetical protein DFH06DRAFT_1296315 [Mycena polygramma]KAJ7662734.1 hypothetical protein DFH06DRAFT_1296317 [Mycena polygramma]
MELVWSPRAAGSESFRTMLEGMARTAPGSIDDARLHSSRTLAAESAPSRQEGDDDGGKERMAKVEQAAVDVKKKRRDKPGYKQQEEYKGEKSWFRVVVRTSARVRMPSLQLVGCEDVTVQQVTPEDLGIMTQSSRMKPKIDDAKMLHEVDGWKMPKLNRTEVTEKQFELPVSDVKLLLSYIGRELGWKPEDLETTTRRSTTKRYHDVAETIPSLMVGLCDTEEVTVNLAKESGA